MTSSLLDLLRAGLASTPLTNRPAGIEIRQDLRPAGGLTAKPPSYEGDLEIHPRRLEGEDQPRDVVELDSTGSAANRIEDALLDLHRAGEYPLPVASTTIDSGDDRSITVTTLEMPHRSFDAWLRLAEDADGTKFEDSPQGHDLTMAHTRALDALLETSAHDLLLGVWDSHRKGPHGQLRIARSLTTSLIGILPVDERSAEEKAALIKEHKGKLPNPYVQQPIAARRDPLNLGDNNDQPKGAPKLSERGLSSIPPTKTKKTVSIDEARYLGYLSFPALRRLGFANYDDTDVRVLLALLALYGLLLRDDQGWDLRAGASFVPASPMRFTVVRPNGDDQPIELGVDEARQLLDEAIAKVNIKDRKIELQAGKTLNTLVQNSIADAKKKA